MAHYIRRVRVSGLFDQDSELVVDFEQSINCIYGLNGTGKTVFINLIVNILRLNLSDLARTQFETVTILIAGDGKKQPENFLTVTRDGSNIEYVFYSEHETKVDILGKTLKIKADSVYRPKESKPSARTFAKGKSLLDTDDEAIPIPREILANIIREQISLTYVPLLRHSDSIDYHMSVSEMRRQHYYTEEFVEVVDPNVRVLTQLQEEIARKYTSAQSIINKKLESLSATIFEKLLFREEVLVGSNEATEFINKLIQKGEVDDMEAKAESIVSQISELNLNIFEKKIREHYRLWVEMQNKLLESHLNIYSKQEEQSKEERTENSEKYSKAYFNLLASARVFNNFENAIQEIQRVHLSKQEVLSPFNRLKEEINGFLSGNKKFTFDDAGEFYFSNKGRELSLSTLSSGEKHLVAILGRVCLSSFSSITTFIADEPELSLHLEWQREILPAIRRLSPGTQVIVATHAPAIISKDANKIDIEECYKYA